MWMRHIILLGLVVLPSTPCLAADKAAEPSGSQFFFRNGDTIVVIGDSITEQHLYSNYLEMWTASRFPTWKLTFRNVGIGGDTSPGGNRRFQRDVLAYKPTAMTVDFGMNDGRYTAFKEENFKRYMDGLQGMADQAQKANIRVAWITPQPTERREPGTQRDGYNLTLETFSAGVKEIAEKNHGLFVDQFHAYLAVMEKARAQDPRAIIMGGDKVHPGPPGQSVMAWAILKGLHFPRLVSAVEIDCGPGGKTRASNCRIEKLASQPQDEGLAGPACVVFERTDLALPFFPPEARSILKYAPVLEDLNDYRLKITGLDSGRYVIRLGGKKIATYTAEELARGVNLAGPALAVGPVADQVNAVWKALEEKNRYFHDRVFRGVVLAKRKDGEAQRQADYLQRMQRMPELDDAVRRALRPRAHLVEVRQVTPLFPER